MAFGSSGGPTDGARLAIRDDMIAAGRLTEATILNLHARLANQSKECVMETLGISASTWLKIKRHETVRSSLIARLREWLPV